MVLSASVKGLALVSLAGGVAAVSPALGQPTFTDMGVLPSGLDSSANGVSRDGNVAVGGARVVSSNYAVRWTRQGGLVNMGFISGGSSGTAYRANVDGTVIMGVGLAGSAVRPWRWSGAGLVNLGVLPGFPATTQSTARDMSDDGSVIVGDCQNGNTTHPFRWTSATGMVDLGVLPGGSTFARANAISGNGQVIVGFGGIMPALSIVHVTRWENGVLTDMGTVPGQPGASAQAANWNGSAIAGISFDAANVRRPMYWDAAGGMRLIGLLPGTTSGQALSMTADGSVVVGYCDSNPATLPFIWTQAGGMRNLREVIASLGLSTGSILPTWATGISADGSVIVGVSGTDGHSPQHGWVLDLRADTDGDGLRDDWEILGIPYSDAAGAPQRYPLPAANPAHKDLYIELDRMAGISVDNGAIAMVVQAFADAPLSNPDGVPGVTLHVQVDEGNLPYIESWHTSNGCWPDSFDETFMQLHYGTAAERSDPRGLPLRLAKQRAYRYGVLADRSDADLGGCGKIGGDVFTVYTGGVGAATEHWAAAFMHEFGHNLGLRHGGVDNHNGKPNYPSIMNYVVAYKAPWNEGFWRLDYSRVGPEGFGTLDELHLDEHAGIGTLLGAYHDWVMPFGINASAGGARAVRYALLNGSPVDFGGPDGQGVPDGLYTSDIIQDLNYLVNPPAGINMPSSESPADHLLPYNDWEHVVLATYASQGPGAPLPSVPTGELTITARDWMAQNFPPPGGPPPCYANCDGSTITPVLNVLDFNCFLNSFAAGSAFANCDGSTIAPVLNVLDFNCFLNRFAAGCP